MYVIMKPRGASKVMSVNVFRIPNPLSTLCLCQIHATSIPLVGMVLASPLSANVICAWLKKVYKTLPNIPNYTVISDARLQVTSVSSYCCSFTPQIQSSQKILVRICQNILPGLRYVGLFGKTYLCLAG